MSWYLSSKNKSANLAIARLLVRLKYIQMSENILKSFQFRNRNRALWIWLCTGQIVSWFVSHKVQLKSCWLWTVDNSIRRHSCLTTGSDGQTCHSIYYMLCNASYGPWSWSCTGHSGIAACYEYYLIYSSHLCSTANSKCSYQLDR